MNFDDYTRQVKRTVAPMNDDFHDQLHMVIGISTEAGELLDAYKKALAYGKDLDKINIGEEVGDLFWYIANLMRMLGLDFEQVLQVNVDKLMARYPEKFDSLKATTRNLEKEREILGKLGFNSKDQKGV